jgi:hypothetical protein
MNNVLQSHKLGGHTGVILQIIAMFIAMMKKELGLFNQKHG